MPEAVIKPATSAEISRIMQLANAEMIPVTPRGAGSGLSGGAVPVFGGIVLSLERMNKILEIDKDNFPSIRERFWSVRRGISDALKAYYPGNIAEDIVVPPAAIPRLIDEVERLSREHNLESTSFGHLGDGNIHVHLLTNKEMPLEQWHRATTSVLEKLYQTANTLGGTLSGEHGIGHKRKKYMPYFISEKEISLMKKIKAAFDPHNILNPGKIFD